jgi:Cu2+-exporting ATPase
MSCVNCSNTIENSLRANSDFSLEYFHVDLTTADPKKTTLILQKKSADSLIEWERIKAAIEEIGFECKERDYQPSRIALPTNELQSYSILDKIKKLLYSHWFLGAVGCISGLGLLIACLASGGMLPLGIMLPLAIISVVLIFFLGANSYREAWKKFSKSNTLTMDSLFAVSTLSVVAVSIASFFIPWLPMMFDAGLLIYGFRHIGLAIEETLKEKISTAQFQDRIPNKVRLCLPSGVMEVELNQINPDSFIEVHPGELIPLDGFCDSDSSLYTTIITGSTIPHHMQKGARVLAGMKLAEHANPLKIKVLHDAKNSYLAKLDAGIAQSTHEKAPIELKTQKILTYFIPAIIAFALLSGVIVSAFFPIAIALQCALSVLVSACPCTLGLVIPLAVKTGIHKAAEFGVYFKNSKALQQAEQIDTVLFDLNGTLTTGIPSVKHFDTLPDSGVSKNQLLSIAASLESTSNHPIGKAIFAFTQSKKIEAVLATTIDSSHHSGLRGEINEQNYLIGSRSLMQEYGINIECTPEQEDGDSVVFLATAQRLLGYIIITDPLRKDAKETISRLTAMGKEVHLCTGADESTALRYAKSLGITTVHANTVAISSKEGDRSKPRYIKLLQKAGRKVSMIGDASNDANALAASDLGFAIRSANSDELTQQNAGAVIQQDSLMPIANAFAISAQTVSNIKQNLLLSLGYNLTSLLIAGGLLLTIGLVLNPAIGAAFMALQAALILFNVYLFKQKKLPHLATELQPEFSSDNGSSWQVIAENTPKVKKKSLETTRNPLTKTNDSLGTYLETAPKEDTATLSQITTKP